MEIQFIKLQSCGQDYIVVDTFKNTIVKTEQLPDMAAQITSRHYGVGAFGLVLVLQGTAGRLRMLTYGPQGSEAPADPLAVRCLARYAFDAGLAGSESFSVETRDGGKQVEVLDAHNITICSGPPCYWERGEPIRERSGETFNRTLQLGERELNYTPVRMEDRFAVFFPSGTNLELHEFGRAVESSRLLPKHAHIVFVRMISREELSLRIWDTGKGELLASEGGACSAVVASVLSGFSDRQVLVHLEGGNLFIDWSGEDNRLLVSGPAEYVFMGTYYYEEAEANEE